MIEADQHGGFLDLAAFAVLVLHLQRGVIVGQHGAGLEGTVFFEKNVHVLRRLRQEEKGVEEQGAIIREAPTARARGMRNPSDAGWTLMRGECQDDIDVIAELSEAVVASLHQDLPAPPVAIHREAPVQQFIAGGMHQ